MNYPVSLLPGLCAAALLGLSGCDSPPADKVDVAEPTADAGTLVADPALTTSIAANVPPDTRGSDDTLDALVPSNEIPYPIYPNGSKYRVGGEHGLKIVVFETADSFEEVDAFYAAQAEPAGMPRLSAMSDYVRYGSKDGDDDPWATDRPGIVLHRFGSDAEREAVGASKQALTNIIMSY